MNQDDIFKLVQKHFPQNEWQNAMRVIGGESGFNVNAVGDNYPIRGLLAPSYGLFQIRALKGRPNPKTLLDPEENIKYAAKLFKSQKWQPWTIARKLGLPGTTPLPGQNMIKQIAQAPTAPQQQMKVPAMASAKQPQRVMSATIKRSPVSQLQAYSPAPIKPIDYTPAEPTDYRRNEEQSSERIPVPSIASRYL